MKHIVFRSGAAGTKKAGQNPASMRRGHLLLDLAFFELDMLAHDRIILT